MIDDAVGPVGLLSPGRQSRLLAALRTRCESTRRELAELATKHAEEVDAEQQHWAESRTSTMAECREKRLETLRHWDDAEEQIIAQYEKLTAGTRVELNRIAAIYRRKLRDAHNQIEHTFASDRAALQSRYDKQKTQPGRRSRAEIRRIEGELGKIRKQTERARQTAVGRLGYLPDVPTPQSPEKELRPPTPTTIGEAVETIESLRGDATAVIEQMTRGTVVRLAESFYLPVGALLVAISWAAIAWLVGGEPRLWWAVGGVPVILLIAFVVYVALQLPLKKLTRATYPQAERIDAAARAVAEAGGKVSARIAGEAEAKLAAEYRTAVERIESRRTDEIDQTTKRLAAEERQHRETLIENARAADATFVKSSEQLEAEMLARADRTANEITDRLAEQQRTADAACATSATRRRAEINHRLGRLRHGMTTAARHAELAIARVAERFPPWEKFSGANNGRDGDGGLDFIPLADLDVASRLADLRLDELRLDEWKTKSQTEHDEPLPTVPSRLPTVLHRRRHDAVLIRASAAAMPRAIDAAHQVLWRLLTAVRPGGIEMTLIDPIGRGQHFTGFMALADHDPALVGHRVWTSAEKIEQQLGRLGHHVEDMLQSNLRDRFARVEDYNAVAGSLAQPYHAVAAIGFPQALSREGHRHLSAIIESGLRCGLFTILVCDREAAWPTETPLPTAESLLEIEIDDDDATVSYPGLDDLPCQLAAPPPTAMRSKLAEQVGRSTVAAAAVEIPLRSILPPVETPAADTGDAIEIPIGSQGGDRFLSLRLGRGVAQHALVAGKTGSGKSTLLHSIVTAGAAKYRPDQLQFYLLDFKKGVEFKPYADSNLPHARVIGIESEREFGRSVLQKLDRELTDRGERFRARGVQELSAYRDASGQPLPRLMLIIDEFQEIFTRDDRLAAECSMLLDRLVRQGRSFGMHVILSSQSLAGAYSLPRNTLGQMAVRIALQCSESDAAVILADDNTAARFLRRPGEAIYNDAGGLIEGNQPFQVARLAGKDQRELLGEIAGRDHEFTADLGPMVVFEGNKPGRWSPTRHAAMDKTTLSVPLGEAVEIAPPVTLSLIRETGRNVLLIAPPEATASILAIAAAGFRHANAVTQIVHFDGARDNKGSTGSWLAAAGVEAESIGVRDAANRMVTLADEVRRRHDSGHDSLPVVVLIDPLDRFRDLRQDDSFSFSLDASGEAPDAAKAFRDVLRDGPPVGVFVIVVCDKAETLSRFLPRASHHDLEQRVLGSMNANDSSLLIDTPEASALGAATMLIHDEARGETSKFRWFDRPDPAEVRAWLGAETSRVDA